MDSYAEIRSLQLLAVLSHLGFVEWKAGRRITEWTGACPSCKPKTNRGNFSFDQAGKFNCFSGCGLKGKGATDLYSKLAKVGFKDAVAYLGTLLTSRCPATTASPPGTQAGQLQQGTQEPHGSSENPPFAGKYEKFQVRPSPWLTARGLTQETLDRYETFEYLNPARKSSYSGSVMLKIRRWSDSACVGYLRRSH